MGHLVNPISFRLSVNSFWSSNWVLLNNFNYINVFKKDYLLFNYFYWLFNRSEIWTKNFLYSGYKIYRMYKKIIINIYYYDANAQIVKKGRIRFIGWLLKFYLRRIWLKKKTRLIRHKILRKRTWRRLIGIIHTKLVKTEFLLLKNKFNFLFQVNVVNRNNNFDNIFFNFYSTDVLNIGVEAIVNYIGFRLRRKYSLNWILRPVLRDLNSKIRKKRLLGYKILCSGRFTRNQIATYDWHNRGAIRYSTSTSLVKYGEVRVRLKFGLGGIKVWLGFGNNNFDLKKRRIFLDTTKYIPFKYLLRKFRNKNSNYIILYLNYWFFFFVRVLFFKKRNFDLYTYFIKVKIKFLLYFLVKKSKRSIVSFFNSVKYVYKEKHKTMFYKGTLYPKIVRFLDFKFSQTERQKDRERKKKHIKELSLMRSDIKQYEWIQINKNTPSYIAEQERQLKIELDLVEKKRTKLIKKIVKYVRRTRRFHCKESLKRINTFFSLILIKNSKLIIFFKHEKFYRFFNSHNILISNLLDHDLVKKFIK